MKEITKMSSDYHLKALWLIGHGRRLEGLQMIREEILQRPSEHFPHWQLGVQLWKGGEYEDARRELVTALELRSDFYPAMVTLGELARDMGNHEEALKWFESAHAVKPESSQTIFNLAISYRQSGRTGEAISLLSELTEGKARWEGAFVELARMYRDLGMEGKAMAVLRDLVSWNPRYRQGLLMLGNCLSESGAHAEAQAMWQRVLDISDSDTASSSLPPDLAKVIAEARQALSRSRDSAQEP